MKERAAQPRDWIQRHWVWLLILLVLLGFFLNSIGFGPLWVFNLARFGLPPPAGQDCGSIVHSEAPPERTDRADVDIQALTCFWNAYQSCRAATISETGAGTDAGYTDTLTIEQRFSRCAIYGQVEAYVNTNHTNTILLCYQLSQQGDSLQVSNCDSQDPFTLDPRSVRVITLESRVYIDGAYDCGVVGAARSQGTPQQVESCFFTAYNQCLADGMGYDSMDAGVEVQRAFYIDNHCGIGYQRGQYTTTCASLEFQADGLHFAQCGADGDIFVPSAIQS